MQVDEIAYGATARAFHWVTAALVLTMIPAGLVMLSAPSGWIQNFLFDYHRSCGVVLFIITAAWLVWRWKNPPAAIPEDIPLPQRIVAHIVHILLYALLLVQPVVGWIGTSAYGAPIKVFWLFTLPPIVDKDKATADTFLGLHETLGLLMTALVLMHIAGALFHHFVRRDRTLMRMVAGA
ncbi:cytochrome b [Breoghania sp.]|uniref:cytochrome b n=1 Tax=Breoghania sp. TaxID=2065378 RepID=UPI002630BD46|nr:cytochrome b [Breoghania sp.]MDJ0930059.1 cytochrome b [Breoghania sp.]